MVNKEIGNFELVWMLYKIFSYFLYNQSKLVVNKDVGIFELVFFHLYINYLKYDKIY